MITSRWEDGINVEHLHYMQHATTSTDKYEAQEIEVRLRLFQFLNEDKHVRSIRFSDPYTHAGRHCVFDAWVLSAGTWLYVEAKARTATSTAFDTWMIEDAKAKELEWLADQTSMPAVFATITADNVLLLWRLDAPYEIKSTTCAKKTFEQSLGQVKKQMRLYHIDNAQVIR